MPGLASSGHSYLGDRPGGGVRHVNYNYPRAIQDGGEDTPFTSLDAAIASVNTMSAAILAALAAAGTGSKNELTQVQLGVGYEAAAEIDRSVQVSGSSKRFTHIAALTLSGTTPIIHLENMQIGTLQIDCTDAVITIENCVIANLLASVVCDLTLTNVEVSTSMVLDATETVVANDCQITGLDLTLLVENATFNARGTTFTGAVAVAQDDAETITWGLVNCVSNTGWTAAAFETIVNTNSVLTGLDPAAAASYTLLTPTPAEPA